MPRRISLGLLAIAVRTVRQLGAAPSLRQLAAVQALVFTAQEVVERIPGPGQPADVLTERAVLFGLVAQVLVAWLSLRLVRFTVRVVRAFVGGSRPRLGAAALLVARPPVTGAPRRRVDARLPQRRGPPVPAGAATST